MTFLLSADYSELERELDRMSEEPGVETQTELDMGLSFAFATTTAQVHVITGALRGSGKTASEVKDDQWTGQMTWGGPSPGFLPRPHVMNRHRRNGTTAAREETEVVYAWFEKRRGSTHNFLQGEATYTEMFKRIFEKAVLG